MRSATSPTRAVAAQDFLGQAPDGGDAGSGWLIFDQRGTLLVSGDDGVIERHDTRKRQPVTAGELPHGFFVARRPDLVRHHPDLIDTEILRQCEGPARCFERLEIGLPDDEQRVDVARGPAAEVLEPGLEIHDRRPRRLGHETIEHATHGGVSAAESA